MTVTLPLPPLAERFAAIVGRLVEGIGELLKTWPTRDPRAEPPLRLVLLTRTWLLERSEAMRDLIASFRAGTLRPPKPRPPRAVPEGPPPPRRPPGPPPERAPTRFGWFPEMGAEIGAIGDELAALIAEAEMKELAAATPKAGRLLRPLFRILGREIPEWLRLPPRPRKPKPEEEPFRPLDKRYNSVRRWKRHTVAPPEPPPPAPPPVPPPPPDPPPSAAAPRTWPRWAWVDMSR
jgi:Wiskott-Aldrich syndrome protein